MKKELSFVSQRYNHGYTLWLKVDNRKIMLESAIKTESELHSLINRMSDLKHYNSNGIPFRPQRPEPIIVYENFTGTKEEYDLVKNIEAKIKGGFVWMLKKLKLKSKI